MLEQYMNPFSWVTFLGNGAPIHGLPKGLIERSMLLVPRTFSPVLNSIPRPCAPAGDDYLTTVDNKVMGEAADTKKTHERNAQDADHFTT